MEQSSSDKAGAALAAALCAAQAEMQNAKLNKTNPHFNSKFADLSSVREATLPVLTRHGLALVQRTEATPDGLFLITELYHKDGGAVRSSWPLPAHEKPQQMGSALTYARRYCWAAMCGIAAEEDDDGNAAQEAHTGKVQRYAPGEPAKPAAKPWQGPMAVTKLKAEARAIGREVESCADLDQLTAYLDGGEVKAAIEQLKVDLPDWWLGVEDGGGLQRLIAKRQADLAASEQESAY